MFFSLVLLLPASADADDAAPWAQAREALQRMFAAVDAVQDYEVVMDKQQWRDGKLQPLEILKIKHRRSPDCRYMDWIGDLHRGREMIYCPPEYDGKIEVHDGGFMGLFTIGLDPDGSKATKGQLHRIYETGLFMLAHAVRGDLGFLDVHPELQSPVVSKRTVEDEPSTCIDIERGSDLFKTYRVGRREICVDEQTFLPTEVMLWNTDGNPMEHYVYSHYRLNVGFTDHDFDTHNRDYRF
jgi:outer membrane lipoprotein-sorting protein